MNTVLVIFLAGIGGVFAGMGVLYLSIRIMETIIKKWFSPHAEGNTEA